MPSIIIKEQDLTNPGTQDQTSNIAYVIGFAGLVAVSATEPTVGTKETVYQKTTGEPATTVYQEWNGSAYADLSPQPHVFEYPASSGKYYALNPWAVTNTPTLCNTKSDFETLFGTMPYIWQASQSYPSFSPVVDGNMYAVEDLEKSYIYAKELINAGLPVLYEAVDTGVTNSVTNAPTLTAMYTRLSLAYDNLSDKGEYSVKYLTSGAYPTFEYDSNAIVEKMTRCASTRGDCVALIDHSNNPARALSGSGSVFTSIQSSTITNDDYTALFTPYGAYSTANGINVMPASFGYLMALSVSIRTNASWLAVAGVTRGIVPNLLSLNTNSKLTNSIADSYQVKTGRSINAITFIKPYGLTIWGNRTLKATAVGLSATSYLNIRNLVSEVKNVVYTAALRLMYEHNSDILWSKFKAQISPTLDQIKTSYGLSGYQIIRVQTVEKGKMAVLIKLYPVYAVEDFEITVMMTDDEVIVE